MTRRRFDAWQMPADDDVDMGWLLRPRVIAAGVVSALAAYGIVVLALTVLSAPGAA